MHHFNFSSHTTPLKHSSILSLSTNIGRMNIYILRAYRTRSLFLINMLCCPDFSFSHYASVRHFSFHPLRHYWSIPHISLYLFLFQLSSCPSHQRSGLSTHFPIRVSGVHRSTSISPPPQNSPAPVHVPRGNGLLESTVHELPAEQSSNGSLVIHLCALTRQAKKERSIC